MLRKVLLFVSILMSYAIIALCAFGVESAFEWEYVRSGRVLVELSHELVKAPELTPAGTVSTGLGELDSILENIGAYSMVQAVPDFQPRLYLVVFDETNSVEEAVTVLQMCPEVTHAWPNTLVPWFGLSFNPDDMQMPRQWHLEAIDAPGAWAIFRGDEDVQVAIIDGGVTYTHPDLEANIWVNPWEDLNGNGIIEAWEWDGLDNEGNGYVDDFWGWDWIDLDSSMVWPGEDPGPPDNDPSDFGGHGTHCAGDACAATNNGIGVASPGFNSQIMCLRAGFLSSSGFGLIDTYAAMYAVYYAINMGAEVISMSFGGSTPSPYLRNALETASDSGLVLLAAAGNDASSQIQYPAGYDFVMAIAATAPGDYLADFTNFGDWITVCAPGEAIYSTIVEGYSNMSGTSMATPVTAGVAAMVKALKPDWNCMEVGNWIAETADNIDPQNPGFIGLMGGGRVNAAKAVDLFVTIDSLWTDSGDRLYFNLEGALFVQYHKFSGDAFNVTLEVSSDNPRVSISQATHYIGDILEGEIGDNSAEPFYLTVECGGTEYEVIEVNAHFSGDGFEFTQILGIPVGRGRVLIIDADRNQSQRTSAYYEDAMEEMGYSWETWERSDRGELGDELMNYETLILFSGTAETNILPESDWGDLENYLNDGGNLVLTGQNFAQDLVVSQPGVLSDFLLVNYLQPHSNDLTISGIPGSPLSAGMHLIMAGSGGAWNQNSMDVIEPLPGAESVFLYDTTNTTNAAGVRRQISGGYMFYCSFGIEGINDATSGNTRVDVLEMMFDQFGMSGVGEKRVETAPASVQLFPPYPNPFNSKTVLSFQLPAASYIELTVYVVSGREVVKLAEGFMNAGVHKVAFDGSKLTSGVYFARMTAGEFQQTQKILLVK